MKTTTYILAVLCLVVAGCGSPPCEPATQQDDRRVADLIKFDFQGIKIGDPLGDVIKAGMEAYKDSSSRYIKRLELPGLESRVFLSVDVIDEKVEGISISYSSDDRDDLLRGLLKKFGPASRALSNNQYVGWETVDGTFRFGEDYASIWSSKMAAKNRRESDEQKQQLQDSL